MSVGVAFSGGGVKAGFHVGVLAAFEEAGIDIDFVSGTSSGAIVASLFAAGFSSTNILNLFNYYGKKVVGVDGKSALRGMLNAKKGARCINKFDNLEWILYSVYKSKGIFELNDIKKKLAVCCVDANLGKIVYFTNKEFLEDEEESLVVCGGNLPKVVRASCAYPILFEPSLYKRRILVDGGVMMNLPVNILRKMGADKLVAVDVANNITPLKSLSMLDIGFRCIDIMEKHSCKEEIEMADYIIKSANIDKVGLFDFEYINALANEGYYATKKFLKKAKI